MSHIGFHSTAALERGLDGGEDRFEKYFFAIYHCSPDESAGINELREQLRKDFPVKTIPVGSRFVLKGEAAFRALTAYHHAMSNADTLSDELREYSSERVREIAKMHRDSQSLPVPVDLTEGQLSHDLRLEFLTCIAIRNGQVFSSDDEI